MKINMEKVTATGGGLLELGDYRFLVATCDKDSYGEGEDKEDGFVCSVQVLSGSVAGQEGKELNYERFYNKRLFMLAAALGLTNTVTGKVFTKADYDQLLKDHEEGKQIGEFNFEPEEAVNREFYCDVKLGKAKTSGSNVGKRFPQLGWNLRSIPIDEPAAVGAPSGDAAFD